VRRFGCAGSNATTRNDHGLAIDNFLLSWETGSTSERSRLDADIGGLEHDRHELEGYEQQQHRGLCQHDTVTFDSTGLAQPNVQVAAGG
jgi:hypothetical protein